MKDGWHFGWMMLRKKNRAEVETAFELIRALKQGAKKPEQRTFLVACPEKIDLPCVRNHGQKSPVIPSVDCALSPTARRGN